MFHSKCFPGYSGVFCAACPVGFYKYDYSFGKCLQCQNKPRNSHYTKLGETTSLCEYECNDLFESAENNPDCLDVLTLEVQRLGGQIPFFFLLFLFLVISIFIFMGLSRRSVIINEKLKSHTWKIYQAWEDKEERGRGKTSEEDFSLKDSTIWCHTHRMYLIGFNSIRFPWFIPKDFPRDALKKHDREKLINFIDDYNNQLKFSWVERVTFVLTKILYAPIAKSIHFMVRKRKFKALQSALYVNFPP